MSVVHGPISIANVPSVSWKNGGGTTRTLIAEPEGSGMDDFLWRISLAQIEASGSFSSFPGIDRTIMLWDGDGVLLRSPAWPTHALTQAWQPFLFRGEDEVSCELVAGAAADLNLMVRRGAISAELRTFDADTFFTPSYAEVVVLCAVGSISIRMEGQSHLSLRAGEFVSISTMDCSVSIALEMKDSIYVCALIQRLT